MPCVLDIFEHVDEIERLFCTVSENRDFYYFIHLFFRNKHCFVTLKDALHLLEKMQPQLSRFLSYVDNFQYLVRLMWAECLIALTSYDAEIHRIVRTHTLVVVEVVDLC